MNNRGTEPGGGDNIDCHLQRVGAGTLICSAARQTGELATNEVDPTVCFHCEAGKIFREVGCEAVSPKIVIYSFGNGMGHTARIDGLFCRIRKRYTNLEYCKTCQLATAETTRQMISTARGLFETHGFFSAYKDIEAARSDIRDGNCEGAITHSIACLESVMRICHEKMSVPLPDKPQITDLWKSSRTMLRFEDVDSERATISLLNALNGVVTQLARLRNALSDAHGRGATSIRQRGHSRTGIELRIDPGDDDHPSFPSAARGNTVSVIRMQAAFPKDEDGFFRRACPYCQKEFKILITEEDLSDLTQGAYNSFLLEKPEIPAEEESEKAQECKLTCPYCGQKSSRGSWWTEEQLAYIRVILRNIVARTLNSDFIRPLQRDLGRSTHGMFHFKGKEVREREAWISPEVNDMNIFALPCCDTRIKIEDFWKGTVHCFLCGFPHKRMEQDDSA